MKKYCFYIAHSIISQFRLNNTNFFKVKNIIVFFLHIYKKYVLKLLRKMELNDF